jgi:hypothetical protein
MVVSLPPELGADKPSSQPNPNSCQNEPPEYEYVIEPDRQLTVIKEYHRTALGGHQGSKPLLKWPRMLHTIDEYNKP